jgi:hypothetical protein
VWAFLPNLMGFLTAILTNNEFYVVLQVFTDLPIFMEFTTVTTNKFMVIKW